MIFHLITLSLKRGFMEIRLIFKEGYIHTHKEFLRNRIIALISFVLVNNQERHVLNHENQAWTNFMYEHYKGLYIQILWEEEM